jgi:hypothetical protein
MFTRLYSAGLFVFIDIVAPKAIHARVVLNGKSYRSEPAAFGKILSTTETVKAHLQSKPEDIHLCGEDACNGTNAVIQPTYRTLGGTRWMLWWWKGVNRFIRSICQVHHCLRINTSFDSSCDNGQWWRNWSELTFCVWKLWSRYVPSKR